MYPTYIYFMAISLLASLTIYFVDKPSMRYLKLFPPFLLVTTSIETFGFYQASIGKSTVLLYNFFSVFEFCFYFYVISLLITNLKVKRAVLITVFLYAIAACINILFIQGVKMIHTFTYSIGCLLIVAFCIYYFFELFRLPKSVKLQSNPAFWICTGLLFYYCCGFPLYGLFNYLMQISVLLVRNFFTIITILNIFLYSLFTIGFLCIIRTRKYTS
ncbi:hypothetical protein LZZ85_09095 [Terrimonas sp. NA20]|uniref:Uncharacterized protein n=1 Tax=Terrimonas ginsenosidimutans TaxID=2908004 RepID=A0ABS9KQ38_9BACT|nr:hypothetical protein [Terrimonas ginsenosidimutans]MCG2614435.1 hypothetical protein [Terrimonas ginsenosidimutans]